MPTIHVTTKPGKSRDQLWREGDSLVAHIKGIPKDGEANVYLEAYLADYFGVSKRSVTIVKGHTSRYKTVSISMDELMFNTILSNIYDIPQQSMF